MKYLNYLELSRKPYFISKKEISDLVKLPPRSWDNIETRLGFQNKPSVNPLSNTNTGCSLLDKLTAKKVERIKLKKFNLSQTQRNKSVATFVSYRFRENYSKADQDILQKHGSKLYRCCRELSDNAESVNVLSDKNDVISFSGTKTCGSNTCDYCFKRNSYRHARVFTEIFDSAKKSNHGLLYAVVTLPHSPFDSLKTNTDLLTKMSSKILTSYMWTKFKEKAGALGFTNSSFELMVSIKETFIDFHGHMNYVFIFNKPMIDVAKKIVPITDDMTDSDIIADFNLYVSTLMVTVANKFLKKNTTGRNSKKLFLPYLKEQDNKKVVKGGISCTTDFEYSYMAKGHHLGKELSYGDLKQGNGSFHFMHLLHLIHEDTTDVPQAEKWKYIKAFQQIILATHKKNWYRTAGISFYNKLMDKDIKQQLKDETLTYIESLNKKIIFKFSPTSWNILNPTPSKLSKMFLMGSLEVLDFISHELYNTSYKQLAKQFLFDSDDPPPKYEDISILPLADEILN
jgi:hypothetical protein